MQKNIKKQLALICLLFLVSMPANGAIIMQGTPNQPLPQEGAVTDIGSFISDPLPPIDTASLVQKIKDCKLAYLDQQIRIDGRVDPIFYSFVGHKNADGHCQRHL